MSKPLEDSSSNAQPLGRARIARIALFLLIIFAIVGVFVARGIRDRVQASAIIQQDAGQPAAPAVTVVHPSPGKPSDEVVLTGALQPFSDAPIYARASGYLKQWSANLGDRVKTGQVLAEIEAPEMDLQFSQAQANLQQARASLDQAQANLVQAQVNENSAKQVADRYGPLAQQGIVAAQDNDQKQGQYKATVANRQALEQAVRVARASIASQEANVSYLDQLRSYRLVRAPFDGVITARRTDVGSLITSGSGANATELFHVADTNHLRVYVSIPEIYSRSANPGLTADLTLEEFPNRRFPARLVRTNGALDAATRTLLSEFEIDNSAGTLRSGAYAEVHLSLPLPGRIMLVPVSSVMFRAEGSQVGVVADGKVKLVSVQLGKDHGSVIEIVSGISPQDQIIESPPDSLATGMAVRVVAPTH